MEIYEFSSYTLIKRIFRNYVKNQKKSLLIGAACMIVVAITTVISAWLMQPVLDDIFLQRKHSMLIIIPVAVLLNSVIKGVANFYQNVKMKIVGQRILTSMQLDMYSHLIHADIKLFDKHPSGNLLSRFTNDINTLKRCISDIINGIICECTTFVGLLCIMLYQSIHLSVAVLLVFPIAIYPMLQLGRRMRKIASTMQEELSDFTVRLDETFQNIRIIKSYCREIYEISRAKHIVNRILAVYKRTAYIESASSPIMEIVGGIAVAVVIWYGGYEVIKGQTTPGAFFSFITALLMLYKPLKAISQLNNTLQEGLAAARRLFNILDEKPKIVDGPNQKIVSFTNYNISFSDVSFSYDNNQHIIKHLNITIPQGKTVAFVGTSGVGKTTILSLLQRLYEPNSGTIKIGGYNIDDIKLSCLRSTMALVSQDIALFDDTIMENIRYGKLNATDKEVIAAAKAAAADDFITAFPDQYKTQIGQNGVKLSGGQRQRIAIARAILKDAPILLLDEATSALDSISERQVQEALENLKRGKTTIVIAHRLSTIKAADVIYLLGENGISESGNHDVLIKKKGEYYAFYQQYKDQSIS